MSDKEQRIANRVTRRLHLTQESAQHYHAAYDRLTGEHGLSADDLNGLCPLIFVPADADLEALQNDLNAIHFVGLLMNLDGIEE